jgi:peroxiredoxin Q/BCP
LATLPEVGQAAPRFRLETANGQAVDLADLTGRPVVLFFFPKASTPG